MKKLYLFIFVLISLKTFSFANENLSSIDNLFHIDQMNSHNKNFALYFKTREKAILAKGESINYITDYPLEFGFHILNDFIVSFMCQKHPKTSLYRITESALKFLL